MRTKNKKSKKIVKKRNRRSPVLVARVAIEIGEDGKPMFWVYNYGFHAGQGGMEFGYGNSGCESLEGAMDLLKHKLMRDEEYLVEMVRKRLEE